jgi:hypothetical protein
VDHRSHRAFVRTLAAAESAEAGVTPEAFVERSESASHEALRDTTGRGSLTNQTRNV